MSDEKRLTLGTSRSGSAVLALVELADGALAVETTEGAAVTRWPLPENAEAALLGALRARGEPLLDVSKLSTETLRRILEETRA
jgi:hypothetical protein